MISEGAEVLARYTSSFYAGSPAVLRNGNAYYVAFRSDGMLEDELISDLADELSLSKAPVKLDEGVTAVRRGDYLFIINFSDKESSFTPDYEMRDLLTGKNISGEETLPVNGVMVLEEI